MKVVKVYKEGDSMTDLPAVGIYQNNDGEYIAITYTTSKSYKTLKGAERFMKKRGYE